MNRHASKKSVAMLGAEKSTNRQRKESYVMPKYISLLRFTEQGAKNLKKSTNRAHTFKQIATQAGVQIEAQYWTLGTYDGVVIISADSEHKALQCLSQLASQGNVRSETMQAFIDSEFDEIVSG